MTVGTAYGKNAPIFAGALLCFYLRNQLTVSPTLQKKQPNVRVDAAAKIQSPTYLRCLTLPDIVEILPSTLSQLTSPDIV